MAEDTFEFFGLKSDYNEYKKQHNIVEDNKPKGNDDKSEEEVQQNPVRIISPETASLVDEDTLRMLKRTRHLHDVTTVYMQSDISFYDAFYTSSDEDKIDDEELLQEARSIRRVYKSYPEYLYAMTIRDLYIEALEEKVGNDLLLSVLLHSDQNKYWIPPIPIYSKRAEDYENGKYGVIDTSDIFEWDDDLILETLQELSRYKEIPDDPEDIEVAYNIVTDHFTMLRAEKEDTDKPYNVGRSVNLADMDELQKIFRSWYQDDSSKESKKKAEENALSNRAFSKTPERIIHDYYMSQLPTLSQPFSDLVNGVPAPSTYNPNEMVYDDVTGKPMSRKEYDARVLFRQLKDAGWTNELKMMRLLGVGSSREYSIIQARQRKKKLRSNKTARSYASESDTGIYGDKNIANVEVYSDLSSLKAQMFKD